VAVATFGALVSVAVAAPPGAPPNDDYLQSFSLNQPRTVLERKDTLGDKRDTTKASTQNDVFNPPNKGGPAEPTACGTTSYGKTVWYDFYPDVPGLTRIRASGYDTVITVVPFNGKTGVPDFASRQCVNGSSSTTEELLARVAKGASYTIQIGGVGNTGGNLEFLFDFLADTDGDGVLDDVDKCKRLKGTSKNAGCPTRLKADVTLRAKPTASGIELVALTVTARRGVRVEVTCTRGCRKQVKRKTRRKTTKFPRLKGKRLGAGSKLVIRVTKRRAIGAYVSYRISKGNFRKTERCMNPGSRKPRRRCG
jgi:hypothetical protein